MRFTPLTLLFTTLLLADPKIEEKDFSPQFEKFNGTMVIYDDAANKYVVYNLKRSTRRFTPFSTFKIPNSIIALETGVIKNVDSVFTWDSTRYPAEAWWPEQWYGRHTMRTAISNSVVPFYREIAARIGEKRMEGYVHRFSYGNEDISSGADNFWLNGSLSISAMEQVEFLRRFYDNQLGVGEATTQTVKDILVREQNSRYRLSAKTGGGTGFDTNSPGRALGWYVGYVERGTKVYYFAMNIEGETFAAILHARSEITGAVLKSLRIIE